MSDEGQKFDRKSIRYVLGKSADAHGLAADCVGLANAAGGVIHLGVEDASREPPPDQRIPAGEADRLRKRLGQLTVNVGVEARLVRRANGGEFLEVSVFPNPHGVASTTSGIYFIRIADETRRLLPDDLGRLWADRGSLAWELQTALEIPRERRDREKTAAFCARVRASERVSDFVKAKNDDDLLNHYLLTKDGLLTNLGVLWVGRTPDRAALQHAPMIQCLKYDESGRKIRKWSWDDFSQTPLELIEAVWAAVPDWRETYELPDGLFRKTVPHYDEVVVRELLANALVHRPYTTRGDIYVNLYPDRLEVHNPGLLPAGVTAANILHSSNQRNPHLARVFYDLKMMEREGSGFDRMYQVQLSSGRPAPEVREGDDRVVVTIGNRIMKREIIGLMAHVDQAHQPTQRELITLGLIAQHDSLRAVDLAKTLGLRDPGAAAEWIGRLRDWGVVASRGRTKATEYFVAWNVLRKARFRGRTTLKGIEVHRLRELILRDLAVYGETRRSEIHARIGAEIPLSKVRGSLRALIEEGLVEKRGEKRGRRYVLTERGANT